MKILIVFDTAYGNTEQIARAIGASLGTEVRTLRAGEADISALEGVELLAVGSPTQGGRPTQPVRDFLRKIPKSRLAGVKVAAFDTRVPAKWVGVFGFASGRIEDELKKKGGMPAVPHESFFVDGTKGPVTQGELERAGNWLKAVTGAK